MRSILTTLLLSTLIGCSSGRNIRTGDHAALSEDWMAAYQSYERATHARPGSAAAQQRLADARREVMAILDGQIAEDLTAGRFVAVGQLLETAGRYDPPRAWRMDHAEATIAAIRADVAGRTLPEAHAVLSDCAALRPLAALASDRDAAGLAWADDLQEQAEQAAGRGDLGGALVLLSGAQQLTGTASDALQQQWWARLRSEEWGGMHLSVRGPSPQSSAVSDALAQRWAHSPWSDAPVVRQRPDRAHLSASMTITAAGCDEEQLSTEQRTHRYTDGTFAANPHLQALHEQHRDRTRALQEAEASLLRAQQRLQGAQRREARAEADVAEVAPRLEAARRRDAEAVRILQAARTEHDASLAAQAAIQERERMVAALLEEQRTQDAIRHDLEQRVLPERQLDRDRARQARDRAEQAGAVAEQTHAQLAATIADAEQRIADAQATLDSAGLLQDAAEEARAALPAHRSQLKAARTHRKEAREVLTEAQTADEAATASLQALRDAEAALPEDRAAARAVQVEARAALETAQAALEAARAESDRLKEAIAALEATAQRGEEQDTAQTTADLTAARRDRDVARAALSAVASDQAHAREAIAAADARLKEAKAELRAAEDARDEIRSDEVERSRRLGQLEAEISALLPSRSLLSERSRNLSRAETDRHDAARHLQAVEAAMAPLHDARAAAAQVTAERQEAHQRRESDRAAHMTGLRALESDLAATPAEIEVVKSHAYTAAHWRRTCTFTVEGPQVRTAATTHDDVAWTGFAHGGLADNPLRYTTEDAVGITDSREAVVAAIWSDLSGQLLAQGAEHRRQARSTTDLEAATRAWLLSDWLAPNHADPSLAGRLRARYPVPPQ